MGSLYKDQSEGVYRKRTRANLPNYSKKLIRERHGKKEEGKKAILQGVQIIKEKSSQIDSFLSNVWLSGAYLRLAKLLRIDNPAESRLFLNQAKEIIDSDKRLVIRKQQLNAFIKNLANY